MKTSNKILIGYVALMLVFYTAVAIANVCRVKQSMPLALSWCERLASTPVQVADLTGTLNCEASAGRGERSHLSLLMPLDPETLSLRGDTLVVCGIGRTAFFGKQSSRIVIPTLRTVIDREGTRQLRGDAAEAAEAVPAADSTALASPADPQTASGNPQP